MRKLLYAGSFDPVTLGHMDLIRRASKICDELIVAVMINPEKHAFIPAEQRVDLIRRACRELEHVRVTFHSGLLIDCAREHKVDAVIRGLRPLGDFDSEFSMAQVNRMLGDIETLMIAADERYAYISSSMVRQIISFNGDIKTLVPPDMADEILKAVREGSR